MPATKTSSGSTLTCESPLCPPLTCFRPYVLEYEKNKKLRDWLEKKQCLYRHQHLLDYDTQFIQAYKDKPKMLWTWIVHIGHNNEYLSKELDPHLLDFFKKNKKEVAGLGGTGLTVCSAGEQLRLPGRRSRDEIY